MRIDYARVSTKDQEFENQKAKLANTGCDLFFEEKISGAAKMRPKLEEMLGQLRKNEVVVVTKLDRLTRSTAELLRIAEAINKKMRSYNSLTSHGLIQPHLLARCS